MADTNDELLRQIEELKQRLRESEETLDAIRSGEVDALVVSGQAGEQVFTLKGADETYRTIVETMREGSAVLDKDGTILYANRQLSALLEVPLNRLIGSAFSGLVRHGDARPLKSFLEGRSRKAEFVLSGPTRRPVPVLLSASPLAMGGREGLCLVITDLTERKQAEHELQKAHDNLEVKVEERTRELKESEERYRTTVASIGDAVVTTDEKGLVTFLNPISEQLTGWKNREVVGRPLDEVFTIINDQTLEAAESPVYRVLREGGIVILSNHISLVSRDGRRVPIEDSAAPIRDGEGRLHGVVMVFHDVTGKRRAEEVLRRQAALIDLTPDATLVRRPDGALNFLNRGAEKLYGWSKDEATGRQVHSLLKTRFPEPIEEIHDKLKATGTWSGEFTQVTKEGREIIVQSRWLADLDDQGEMVAILESNVDVTGQKRAQRALEHAAERLDIVSTTASGLLLSEAPQLIIEPLCRRAMEHLGCHVFFNYLAGDEADCLRLNAYAGITEESARKIEFLDYGTAVCGCAAREGQRVVAENIPQTSDAPTELIASFGVTAYAAHPLIARGRVLGTLSFGSRSRLTFTDDDLSLMGIVADHVATAMDRAQLLRAAEERADELEVRVRDRTRELQQAYDQLINETKVREKAEALLRQAQKMEALGTLTGGIAHDFNNILAAIIGFAELAAGKIPTESDAQRMLKRVLDAGIRGRDLVRQMLAFSRKADQERKPILISAVIRETMKLMRASIPTTINIHTDVEDESGLVMGDPIQIQQVVMNLCTNAAHAMGKKGGTLKVELTDFAVAHGSEIAARLLPGSYARLVVSDTGHGMDPETIVKIFDPFFTTKKVGEGTGLGLSVVHGIVEAHQGYITVESTPKVGSVFTVYFPKEAHIVRQERAVSPIAPTGAGHVLFIDDEEVLAEMGKALLEDLGYEVTAVTNSHNALDLFRQDPSRFDIVITDQTMPDLPGVELAEAMLTLKPGVPIILCTGFSHLVDAEAARAKGIKAFVMKPLTKKELAQTIRSVQGE